MPRRPATLATSLAISLAKAEPVGAVRVPDLAVFAQQPVPDFTDPTSAPAFYAAEAKRLERALHLTLPGGTYDALLGLMLARKASVFRVRG